MYETQTQPTPPRRKRDGSRERTASRMSFARVVRVEQSGRVHYIQQQTNFSLRPTCAHTRHAASCSAARRAHLASNHARYHRAYSLQKHASRHRNHRTTQRTAHHAAPMLRHKPTSCKAAATLGHSHPGPETRRAHASAIPACLPRTKLLPALRATTRTASSTHDTLMQQPTLATCSQNTIALPHHHRCEARPPSG